MQQPLLVDGKKLTLEQWLDNMQLSQFGDKFRDMRLGELLSYTDKDIEDLCDEFEIKMPFKKRLSDAVHVLQANKKKIELIREKSKNNKDGKKDGKFVGKEKGDEIIPITRTIISAEEEKAFDSIDERYKDIIQSISDTQQSINNLKIGHKKCKQDINITFDKLITKLNNRRSQLIERLNFEGNKKMKIIKDNKEKLINYKQSIESCQSDADKLTMDVTMDRKTRKKRILQIEKYVYKYAITNNIKLTTDGHVDDNFLRFDYKSQTAQKALSFVSNYGNILVNEVPIPPIVNIIAIGITRCKINFKLDPNSNPYVEKPKAWIVEYRLWQQQQQQEQDDDDDDDDDVKQNQWIPKAKLENVNDYILDSLKPNTKYSIRVCCSNNNGWSEYSQIVNLTTKAIEGGIDSKIINLKEKKILLKLLADKFDTEIEEKQIGLNGNNGNKNNNNNNNNNNNHKKKQSSSFLGGIFGVKSKNIFVNEDNINLHLLFRGSRDGFEADKFHEKCDLIKNTIIIIQVAENKNVFGGFTKIAWKSPRNFQFVNDDKCFLFNLRNNISTKDKPSIFEIKQTDIKYAVCHDPKYGPIFGNGYSLCIYDRCNEVDTNYTNPISFNFREKPNQLSGKYNFTVKDYEVFQVHLRKLKK